MKRLGLMILLGILSVSLLLVSACQKEECPTATLEPDPILSELMSTEGTEVCATETPSPTPTKKAEVTLTPKPIEILPVLQKKDIYWKASFETGDLSELEENYGEFLRQSQYGYYQVTSNIARHGNYSTALTINTANLGRGMSAAAYLAYYDNPDAAYYSGWLYIPEEVTPLSWWNVWQWKSTFNGDSDDSVPMWILDLTNIPTNSDELRLTLVYRPDDDDLKVGYTNVKATIPKGEWVHISTYYVKSFRNDGVVGVWVNGEEIFYIENAHTVQSDNTVYWSVNNYTDSILPEPCTIYFDDLVISTLRFNPHVDLP